MNHCVRAWKSNWIMSVTRGGQAIVTTVVRHKSAVAAPTRRSLVLTQSNVVARQPGRARSCRGAASKGPASGRIAFSPSPSAIGGKQGSTLEGIKPLTTAASGGDGGGSKAKPAQQNASPPLSPPTADAGPIVQEVTAETTRKNIAVGFFLVMFAAGTYYYTINSMGKQDFLGEVEKEAEEEAMVHLRNSKLEVKKLKLPTDAVDKAAPAVEEATAPVIKTALKVAEASTEQEVVAAMEELAAVPETLEKKKGWRKYWLFGPRVGGNS